MNPAVVSGCRVVVAMSGGVDSSTTAALLKEAGHEVIGMTMQLYDHGDTAAKQSGTCCSLDDVHDARRVANALDIPHYVVNLQDAFRKLVVDNMVDEYRDGRTPNPCVRCNEFMKFRLLLDRALALGADYLATGHYAKIVHNPVTHLLELRRAEDSLKDQSYFLYCVDQQQLSHLLFPLGAMTKSEVRAHAQRFQLPTATKSESQDVCFIAGESYRQFMERHDAASLPGPGEIVSVAGDRLGQHHGHHRYTVGQRKGLGLARSEPLYVVGIDATKNQVTVGGQNDLLATGLKAKKLQWISGVAPARDQILSIKIRYRTPASPGYLTEQNARVGHFRFVDPVRAVTPGQTVVVYDGDTVLGGGLIEHALGCGHESAVSDNPREGAAA